jgi:hypothetical protein
MKINGLNVNAQAIADGLYDIICAQNEEALVAFGMIPKWAVDMTEKQMREKVIREAARQLEVTVTEFAPFVDDQKVSQTVGAIMKEVCTGIYAAAKRKGAMVV